MTSNLQSEYDIICCFVSDYGLVKAYYFLEFYKHVVRKNISISLRDYFEMADDAEEWSDTCYSLKDLVKNFTLPQLVMVDEGYMLNENESLATGQLITIQSHEDVTHFKGLDSEGKSVSLPTKCPFKIKVIAEDEGRVYNSLRELCAAVPRPKYVEVKPKSKKDHGFVKNGDRLKILLTERGPTGPSYLHFRDQRGKHLRLSIDFTGEFHACAEDDDEHLLSDLFGRELPLYVKFVNNHKTSIGDSIGVIELKECLQETLVFSSTRSGDRICVTAFPLSFDVRVRPLKNAKFKQVNDENIDPRSEIIDLESFREYMMREQLVNESGYVCFAPYDVLTGKNKGLKPETMASKATKTEKTSESTECSNIKEVCEDVVTSETVVLSDATAVSLPISEHPIQRDDHKRKSSGFLSKVKFKLRKGNKAENRKSKESRPEIVIVRENGASSDGGDSGIYEEIPGDTYVSMDVIDGVRRALGTSHAAPPARKRSVSRVQPGGNPPPLPGNHPLERRHTLSARFRSSNRDKTSPSKRATSNTIEDKESFKKFYECMKKSENELLRCDIEGIGEILHVLKLDRYVKKFRENQIDGKLLIDLDEAVFKDMGLTPFESRKLRKYVFGWRPESVANKDHGPYCSANEKDAHKWTENEVANHLTSLGLNDLAGFCTSNQVNGDLLWDLVVDDEMIYDLIKGKDRRLNVVKLKNYVTEGWRPKVTKKRANSVNCGTLERNSKSKVELKREISRDMSKTTVGTKIVKTATKIKASSTYEIPLVEKASERTKTPVSRASSVSDQQSPRGSTSSKKDLKTRDSPDNAFKQETKVPNRLHAKVSYPKNSPYTKTSKGRKDSLGKDVTPVDSNLRVEKKVDTPLQSKGVKVAQTAKPVGTSKVTVSKAVRPTVGPPALDSKRQSAGPSKKLTPATKQGAAAEKVTATVSKQSKDVTKDNRVSKYTAKSTTTTKSTTAADTRSAKSIVAKAVKGIEKVPEKEIANTGKRSATVSAPPQRSRTTVSPPATQQPTLKAKTTVARSLSSKAKVEVKQPAKEQPRTVKSPIISNLKRQYEKEEPRNFKQAEPLRRNSMRAAVIRKDSQEAKASGQDAKKPLSSVAMLRKQFDK